MTDDKPSIEREMRQAWETLVAAVETVPAPELSTPGVVDGWSVKDLLGHIAFWAGKAAHDLSATDAGRDDDVEVAASDAEVDEWNERERRGRESTSLEDILAEWRRTYQEADAALKAASMETLLREVKGRKALERFAGDSYGHYREHAAQIEAWRKQQTGAQP